MLRSKHWVFRGIVLFGFTVLALGSLACDTRNFSKEMQYTKARNLHDHGKIDEAIAMYKKILETEGKGDNSEVYYDLGVAYADKNDVVNAKKQVEILKKRNRRDLAEVLSVVIRDSDAARVRKKLQADHDAR